MSDVAATASISLPQTSAATSAISAIGQSTGAEPVNGAVASSGAAISSQSVSGSNYSLNVSESNLTYLSASSSQGISQADQRVMMLIMALIQILFGSRDDDPRQRDAALGLIAGLLQSGQSQQSQQFTYLEYNQIQYSESYSEFQATSVQAASYDQLSSATANPLPTSGSNLNVSG
jgi:hypothetical protein